VHGRAGDPPSQGQGRQQSASDQQQAFADMYDGHAAYVFDYCHSIVGNGDRAAAATQATIIAGHMLSEHLRDPDRLRAWLMALARRECQDSPSERAVALFSARHGRRELAEALAFVDAADEDVNGDSAELQGADPEKLAAVREAMQKLSTEQREILNLVYRYGIDTYELPAILGIDAAGVAELLTDAEVRFTEAVRSIGGPGETAGDGGDWTGDDEEWTETEAWPEANGWTDPAEYLPTDDLPGRVEDTDGIADSDASQSPSGLGWLTALPLVALPASVWRRTSRAVLDPRFGSYREAVRAHAEHIGPDGFPIPTADPVSPPFRRLVVASALLAGLLLAPVGLSWAGYVEYTGSHLAASKTTQVRTAQTSSPSPSPSADLPSLARSRASSSHAKSGRPAVRHTRTTPAGASSSSSTVVQPSPSSSRARSSSPPPSPVASLSSPPSHSPSPSPSPTPTGTKSSSSPSLSPTPTPAASGSLQASGSPSPGSAPGS
jgi:DNA-directed RNA polymerase specialized sigma24 family protein